MESKETKRNEKERSFLSGSPEVEFLGQKSCESMDGGKAESSPVDFFYPFWPRIQPHDPLKSSVA